MRLRLIIIAAAILAATAASATEPLDSARRLTAANRYAESLALLRTITPSEGTRESIETKELIGDNYYSLGIYNRAAELYNEAVAEARANGFEELTADNLNALFRVYYMNSETERAADLLESAAEIYRRLGVRHKQRNVLNNMALVHFARGDVDSALKLLFEALEIARTVDDPTTPDAAEKVTVNIGEAYYRLGEYVKSEKILSEGLANIADKPDSWTKLHMAASLARAKAKLGKKNEARALRAVIDRCIPTTQPAKQPDIYSSLAEIEFLTGDSIQGLRDLLRSRALTDTIESRRNAGVLRQLLVVYDTERLQSRNEALQNSVKNRTIIISIAIVAFMLLLGLLLALWAKLRTDRIVRLQSERIAEIERIEHQRKEEQLIDEIDTRNRQLTSFTIDLAAVNEFHGHIIDSLGSLRRDLPDNDRPVLDDTLRQLRTFNERAVTEDFRTAFDRVHPSFFRTLERECPQLTKNDHRLCAFLLLGMSTKAIAALTFREVRSIESSRLRLRKKLNLPSGTSLYDFLNSLNSQ